MPFLATAAYERLDSLRARGRQRLLLAFGRRLLAFGWRLLASGRLLPLLLLLHLGRRLDLVADDPPLAVRSSIAVIVSTMAGAGVKGSSGQAPGYRGGRGGS